MRLANHVDGEEATLLMRLLPLAAAAESPIAHGIPIRPRPSAPLRP